MKFKHLITLTLIILTSSTNILAQETAKLQDYLPPSPEAQEFIKYGEYPVAMYTGVPNISIPLYTIKTQEIEIPISLSYHASGIQVDQIASWIGLGWSLNAGGMISLVPRGIPDSGPRGFLIEDVPELSELVYDHYDYDDAASGVRDTESDIYHYNFHGYSGKFFFDRDKNVKLIEEVPLKISYVPSAPGISSKFIITTEKGIVYEFNVTESTQSRRASDPPGIYRNYVSSWHLSKITDRNKIDIVTFQYDTHTTFTNNQYIYEESTGDDIIIGACSATLAPNVHGGYGAISSQLQTVQIPKRIKEIVFPNGKIVFNALSDRLDSSLERLSEILIYQKNGASYSKIKSYNLLHGYFSSFQGTVYPINPPSHKLKRLKLTELHELDKNGLNPKKHVFGYNNTLLPPLETNGKDYWGYYNGQNSNVTLVPLQPIPYFGNNVGTADRNPDAISMKAGILNKITYPTGGYTEFSYEPHEYLTTEAAIVTEPLQVFAVGLQNVMGNGMYLEHTEVITPNYSGFATINIEASDRFSPSGVYPRFTLQRAGSSGYIVDRNTGPTSYTYPMNPPVINITLPPVWLDKDVAYTFKAVAEGTSSSALFDGAAYMKADIDYRKESTTTTQVTKLAGGLRIQQIKSFDTNGVFAFSKRYEYNDSNLITPEFFIKEHYLDEEIQGVATCCVSVTGNRRFYYGGTVQSLTLDGGSPVVYGSVDEFMVDASNNDKGKTKYTYTVQTDVVLPAPASYLGGIMLLKKDWMGGQNTAITKYPKNSTDYVTRETKGHTLKKYDESYKMYKIVHSKKIAGGLGCEDGSRFRIFEYPIYRGIKLVDSIAKKTHDTYGNEVTENTSIFYDNETHLQPTRTETTKSDGNTTFMEVFYPDDIANTGSLGLPNLTPTEKASIDRLKTGDLHQVATPIQTVTTVKNSGGSTLSTATDRTLYTDLGSDLVLSNSVNTLKGTYNATTNPLDPRLGFDQYNSRGNPLQVSYKHGPPISYIWGFNGKYPIAKIENASYTDIATALGITVSALKSYDEDNMIAINGLRSSLGSALVTTYAYDPLVGVTSITDPSGLITTYIYDSFNRLKEVRDPNNDIVTDYDYHYKGQN